MTLKDFATKWGLPYELTPEGVEFIDIPWRSALLTNDDAHGNRDKIILVRSRMAGTTNKTYYEPFELKSKELEILKLVGVKIETLIGKQFISKEFRKAHKRAKKNVSSKH